MAVIGRALLLLALGVAVFGIGASLYGARDRVLPLGFLVQRRRGALLDDHADVL
jgi:hypothetical protein